MAAATWPADGTANPTGGEIEHDAAAAHQAAPCNQPPQSGSTGGSDRHPSPRPAAQLNACIDGLIWTARAFGGAARSDCRDFEPIANKSY